MDTKGRLSVEVIAPTVDEAVQQGLRQLGVTLDDVEVEILDRGGRGLFGLFGRRQARVRLTLKTPPGRETTSPSMGEAEAPSQVGRGVQREPETPTSDETLQVVEATVRELLEKMAVRARVSAHYGEADPGRPQPVLVDIRGRDLSVLIGRRAERLNALQLVTRLIVGKELGRAVPVILDVEGYRRRRERQLRNLARRMAERAVRTGRKVVLDPMPANERRVIHIALRDDPRVTTESVGQEPRRRVTIIPVRAE